MSSGRAAVQPNTPAHYLAEIDSSVAPSVIARRGPRARLWRSTCLHTMRGISLARRGALRTALWLAASGQGAGLSAACCTYLGLTLAGEHASWHSLLDTFLLVTPVYAHDRCHARPSWRTRAGMALCPLALAGSLISSGQWAALTVALALLMFGLGYGRLFKPLTATITGFKDLFVASMWTLTLPFAALVERIPWTAALSYAALVVFVMGFINVCACDVKDLSTDRRRGLRTFAVAWGERRLFQALHAVNIALGVILTCGVGFELLAPWSLILVFTLPYTTLYLRVAAAGDGKPLFYALLVDGVFLWAALILALAVYQ
jgi:4-hydroxybenzoate polyprenyltransferase